MRLSSAEGGTNNERSFKTTLGFCDRKPFSKRQANKRVRKDWTLADRGAYGKRFESWNICDYRNIFNCWWAIAVYKDKPWKPYVK